MAGPLERGGPLATVVNSALLVATIARLELESKKRGARFACELDPSRPDSARWRAVFGSDELERQTLLEACMAILRKIA
jgi:hypothetical protein